jgi:predicted Zn finger-like uncharacterized protein
MNLACPECSTVYRIDPDRVPEGGTTARCRECGTAFRVEPDGPAEPGVVHTAARAGDDGGGGIAPARPAAASPDPMPEPTETGSAAPTAPVFGPQDPETRARRLARALVSDIKVYNPEKWEESRTRGTLRKEFRDEILKSWEEYVEQVGEEMAKGTPYFRNALNEILAGGEPVF